MEEIRALLRSEETFLHSFRGQSALWVVSCGLRVPVTGEKGSGEGENVRAGS